MFPNQPPHRHHQADRLDEDLLGRLHAHPCIGEHDYRHPMHGILRPFCMEGGQLRVIGHLRLEERDGCLAGSHRSGPIQDDPGRLVVEQGSASRDHRSLGLNK